MATLLGALFLLLPLQAEAGKQAGLIVRLDGATDLSAPVLVTITGKEDPTPVQAKLADDGKAPDVVAGDGSFSGAASLVGNDFEVRVTIDGKDVGGGPVSWGDADKFRELLVHWTNGTLSLEAANNDGSGGGGVPSGVPVGAAPGSGGQAAGGAPVGASGGAAGSPPAGGAAGAAPATPTVTFPSGSSDPTLYIGLGLGILVLVGIGWLWFRNREPDDPPLYQAGLAPLPEPSLLGAPTRSLSAGLSAWVSSDPGALLRPALATLARGHRVLLVAPPEVVAPPVFGGPVFRAPPGSARELAAIVEDLSYAPGAPLAVLVLDPSVDLQALADAIPEGAGGLVLAGEGTEAAVPSVRVSRAGAGWRFEGAEAALVCRQAEDGLHPADGDPASPPPLA